MCEMLWSVTRLYAMVSIRVLQILPHLWPTPTLYKNNLVQYLFVGIKPKLVSTSLCSVHYSLLIIESKLIRDY